MCKIFVAQKCSIFGPIWRLFELYPPPFPLLKPKVYPPPGAKNQCHYAVPISTPLLPPTTVPKYEQYCSKCTYTIVGGRLRKKRGGEKEKKSSRLPKLAVRGFRGFGRYSSFPFLCAASEFPWVMMAGRVGRKTILFLRMGIYPTHARMLEIVNDRKLRAGPSLDQTIKGFPPPPAHPIEKWGGTGRKRA